MVGRMRWSECNVFPRKANYPNQNISEIFPSFDPAVSFAALCRCIVQCSHWFSPASLSQTNMLVGSSRSTQDVSENDCNDSLLYLGITRQSRARLTPFNFRIQLFVLIEEKYIPKSSKLLQIEVFRSGTTVNRFWCILTRLVVQLVSWIVNEHWKRYNDFHNCLTKNMTVQRCSSAWSKKLDCTTKIIDIFMNIQYRTTMLDNH